MKIPFNYALGLVTGLCLGCLYFMVPTLIDGFIKPAEPQPEPKRFEVVDNYKGCDVVRWTNNQFAEYKYFLDCEK